MTAFFSKNADDIDDSQLQRNKGGRHVLAEAAAAPGSCRRFFTGASAERFLPSHERGRPPDLRF